MLYWSAPSVLILPVHGPRLGFWTEVHQPVIAIFYGMHFSYYIEPVVFSPLIIYWVRSVSWSEYSAPKLKLCFKRPVLNLPVKANWSVKVSVSAIREFNARQTLPFL
jgi:hypothetical protein